MLLLGNVAFIALLSASYPLLLPASFTYVLASLANLYIKYDNTVFFGPYKAQYQKLNASCCSYTRRTSLQGASNEG